MERTYIYKTLLLLMAIFTVIGCDDNKFLEEDPETFTQSTMYLLPPNR